MAMVQLVDLGVHVIPNCRFECFETLRREGVARISGRVDKLAHPPLREIGGCASLSTLRMGSCQVVSIEFD